MGEQLIIMCPGQGAQAVSMGKAWHDASPEARAVFAQADEVLGDRLGAPLSELCFEGPAARLNETDVAQPAIYVSSIACWRGLCAAWGFGEGDAPLSAVAGLSLGEYTALNVAGAIDFADGLELVALRGRVMQEAACAVDSGMVALIGADETQAQAVCDAARGGDGGEEGVLVCANFNAPGQIVLSGDKAACERAMDEASKAGLRATALAVAGAFHSPIMQPAAEHLAKAIAKTRIREPRCLVYANVTAEAYAEGEGRSLVEQIRHRLVQQLASPVRWAQSVLTMASQVSGQWHELAPGRTLVGLTRRIDRSIKVKSHDEPE